MDEYAAGSFVLGWIIFGSYIIGNMFIGILVNNFIQIRKDLMEEVSALIYIYGLGKISDPVQAYGTLCMITGNYSSPLV